MPSIIRSVHRVYTIYNVQAVWKMFGCIIRSVYLVYSAWNGLSFHFSATFYHLWALHFDFVLLVLLNETDLFFSLSVCLSKHVTSPWISIKHCPSFHCASSVVNGNQLEMKYTLHSIARIRDSQPLGQERRIQLGDELLW